MSSKIKIRTHERWEAMIPIKKGLNHWNKKKLREKTIKQGLSPKEAFNKLKGSLKIKVRKSLVEEQGGLCTYCMCKIPRPNVDSAIPPIIIEHFIPRDPIDGRDVKQGLDYTNLFAVCNGNQSSHGKHKYEDLTCDAHRKNIEFKKLNPCKPATLSSIYYTLDGQISARDKDARFDLVNTLNLNCPSSPLVAERKSALDSLITELGEIPENELLAYSRQVLNIFLSETTSKTPYVGILIWYLQSIIYD